MAVVAESNVLNLLWFVDGGRPTVLRVDEQRGEYKRAFASTLLGLRVGHGSQKVLAKVAQTSEATYRRWEDPNEQHLPDAWQISLLAAHFECDASDLVFPEQLSDRESAIASQRLLGVLPGRRVAGGVEVSQSTTRLRDGRGGRLLDLALHVNQDRLNSRILDSLGHSMALVRRPEAVKGSTIQNSRSLGYGVLHHFRGLQP